MRDAPPVKGRGGTDAVERAETVVHHVIAAGLLSSLLLAACQAEGPSATIAGSGACVAPTAVADRDVRRFARTISEADYCVTQQTVAAGGRTFTLTRIDSGRRGPLHVLPHDDENAALPIALYAMGKQGGRLVAVESADDRFAQGVDPNRYFSSGRASAARCQHGSPNPAFAKAVLSGGGRPIIAYHSNDNGYAGGGGSGTISIRRRTDTLIPFPASGDEDNLIVIAGRSKEPNRRNAAIIRKLNAEGAHVLYEVVQPANDDCSLSAHLVLTGGRPYYNIEVQHGDVADGRRLVDALNTVL